MILLHVLQQEFGAVVVDMDHERNLSRIISKSQNEQDKRGRRRGRNVGTVGSPRKTDPGGASYFCYNRKVSKLRLLKRPIKHLVKSMWYRHSCNKIIVG